MDGSFSAHALAQAQDDLRRLSSARASLRTLSVAVISAGALSFSFFGARATRTVVSVHGGVTTTKQVTDAFDLWLWGALVALIGVGIVGLMLVFPRSWWEYQTKPFMEQMSSFPNAPTPAANENAVRRLAGVLGARVAEDRPGVERLFKGLRYLLALFLAETLFLALHFATK
jgi:hypothetical protein